MQAPRRVDEHQVAAELVGLVEHVVAHARGVGAAVALDHGNAGAPAPDVQLLDGGGAEGVCAADHHVLARMGLGARDLADRRGLAGAVDADEQHAARGPVEDVALGLDEELAESLGEGGAQLIGGLEVLPRRGLA